MARKTITKLAAAAAASNTGDLVSASVLVVMPREVYERYEIAAAAAGVSVDVAMENRLLDCADYTAERPIYIPDAARVEIEALLGRSIFSADELLLLLRSVLTFAIDLPPADSDTTPAPAVIQLPFPLIERVMARKWDHNEPMLTHLQKLVQNALAREVGW